MTPAEVVAIIGLATAVVSLIGNVLNRRRMTVHLRRHQQASDARRRSQLAAQTGQADGNH